ncbi:hypothetical protein BHE74_00030886 [Ensete ventricosum]|nr:hypothetical protein GW17_00029145 [Ensete ventricosum]RWW62011.1 hypothetical protein BHE74_00030886 [Ensete ventricosum]RZS25034.1 hypothetical protein BHM03_00058181 [Ensete ventricosum]
MKRGYDETPSTSFGPPKSKLRFDSYGSPTQDLTCPLVFSPPDFIRRHLPRKLGFLIGFSTLVLQVNPVLWRIRASRMPEEWRIITIKSVLIHLYARPKDAVLDIACGKGGDLIKWDKAKIGYYVGVDIAEGSVSNELSDAVVPQVRLDKYLCDDAPFDICSCQVTSLMHLELHDVSSNIEPFDMVQKFKPSSTFGIKYKFHLELTSFYCKLLMYLTELNVMQDAVDCPEWIVPFHVFKCLAEEVLVDPPSRTWFSVG